MAIRVQCGCGKQLSVKDELAGKAVRCPGCQKAIQVPTPSTPGATNPSTPKPSPSTAATKSMPAGDGFLDDLFDEEGMVGFKGPTCPACGKELKPNAVLCTACGTHLQTGQKLVSHEQAKANTPSLGHYALDEAVASMKTDAEMQQRTMNAGMPWWFLLIFLIFISGFTFALVSIVNAATAETDATGVAGALKRAAANSGVVWGCIITGLVIQTITRIWIVTLSFKESLGEGLTTLFLWHKFLGQLGAHPVIGLAYTLGFFTTLSGLGLALADYFGGS